MPHSQFVFFIQMSGFVFLNQSSFIFKRGFLPCSVAFAGYFKKIEILFPAFLLFFFPCLLSSRGHPNQLLQGLIIQCDHDANARHYHVAPGRALQRGSVWFSHLFPLFSAHVP